MLLTIRRRTMIFLTSLLACLILAGCGHSVNLTEKRVDGIDSQITIALPGDVHELPLPVALDPVTQRYLKGQKFYGEIHKGLSIGVFTLSIDKDQMYSDIGETTAQQVGNNLGTNVERAADAILDKIDAENVSAQQTTTSVSGEHAVLQTFMFNVDDKRMKAKLLGFSHGNATWVILAASDVDSDNVSAVDDIIDSVVITK